MFTKKPHGDDLKQDFVLITAEEPERLTYSVIGYESDPNDHWVIRQSATTTTEGGAVLRQLAAQYAVAIFTFTRRSWYKKYCQFTLVDTDFAFDPDEDCEEFPPHIRHQFVVRVLNECFASYARYEEKRKQYWAAGRIEVPIPVKKYALRVPFEEKDAAKECGAIWSPEDYRWIIDFKYDQNVRALLKWAHPEDRPCLLSLFKRKQDFEKRYGKPLREAENRFWQERRSAIQALLASDLLLESS